MDDIAQQWHSAHIYYYEEDKDDLILDCVRPLFQQVAPVARRAFLIRHWLRGPHLRLRFETSASAFAEIVEPAIANVVGHYLRAHPSTASIDVAKMRPIYEKLAAAEQEPGPVLPLYPDNSIQYLPYDRRLHVLGSETLAALIEDFYVETNDMLFEMLDAVRAGHSRLTLNLDLMWTTAHTVGTHITRGFISYRSHGDAFIIGSSRPDAMRALFESKFQSQAEALIDRLRGLLESLDLEEDAFPFTLRWAKQMQRFWERAYPLIESQALDMMPGVEDDSFAYDQQLKANIQHSAFHSLIDGNLAYRQALYNDTWFQCYRLMLNLLYLQLNRLGIRPIERYMLCHLAANTVEQLFNISAADLIAQYDTSLNRGE